jgi:hypothetical protein
MEDAKRVTKKPRKMKEAKAIETEPDAWERFEKAIHTIVPPKKAKTAKDKDRLDNPDE